MIRRAFLASAVVVALAPAAHADEATARILYDQAEALAKQQKWSEACPLYEASYKSDAKLGVLLHLADCHEKQGLTATAAAEFDDAIELAHRQGDTREAIAKKRHDALAPRLAHLRIAKPKTALPGLVVRRDGADVTVLVGTDMPIDPGEHDIGVSAPGYIEAHVKVKIDAQPKTTPLELPALVAEQKPIEPVKPPIEPTKPPEPHDGALAIVTQSDADIALDGKSVGTGRFEGAVKPGRHTLRVSAAGARAYQTEIYIDAGERRSIDVPALEREAIGGGVVVPRGPKGPGWELGVGLAVGDKIHGDQPLVVAARFDISKRIGERVRFGILLESGGIDSGGGSCGTDLAGPQPSTPFDFGVHNQFHKCVFYAAGLSLYVHILPNRKWDPWIGFTPNFRDQSISYTVYDSTGQSTMSNSFDAIALEFPLRVGVDYHASRALAIGGWLEAAYSFGDNETQRNQGKGDRYTLVFGGVRTSVAF